MYGISCSTSTIAMNVKIIAIASGRPKGRLYKDRGPRITVRVKGVTQQTKGIKVIFYREEEIEVVAENGDLHKGSQRC